MHRRIAEALRDQFAESGAAEPELLAHHFTQAGLTEAAIEWWGKRYVAFQMAEVAIPRQMFQEILRLIAELRPQPPPAPA